MVGANAPVNRTRSDVRLDFLVQLEVVLLGQDVDLGTGRLFPFSNARIQRFILLTANELGIDGDAFKFTRKFRSPAETIPAASRTEPASTDVVKFLMLLLLLEHRAPFLDAPYGALTSLSPIIVFPEIPI